MLAQPKHQVSGLYFNHEKEKCSTPAASFVMKEDVACMYQSGFFVTLPASKIVVLLKFISF